MKRSGYGKERSHLGPPTGIVVSFFSSRRHSETPYQHWKPLAICPPYHSPELINTTLVMAKAKPRDYLILRLMSDARLRRGEVVGLQVRNVDHADRMLRLRGKGAMGRQAASVYPYRAKP